MATKTILALTPGHPGQLEALEKDYTILRLWKERDAEGAIAEHANNIVAITTYLAPVREVLMDALPNLEIIAVGAVGYDHIDLEAAAKRKITVTNTPDVLTDDTADLGMTLLLSLLRRVVEGDAFIRAGLWTQKVSRLAVRRAIKHWGLSAWVRSAKRWPSAPRLLVCISFIIA